MSDATSSRAFDVIIANPVNVYFEPDEYKAAIKSVFKALRPGGTFIAFEWIFPHNKEQRVVETSIGHPEALKFWLRSESFIQRAFADVGFFSTLVLPFEIPIELPRPEINGTDADLRTYTVDDPLTGHRLQYRGALYQPWAHIMARRQN